VRPRQPGHGDSRRPVFVGPSGERQFRTLADWVAVATRTEQRIIAASVSEPASETTQERNPQSVIPTSNLTPNGSLADAEAAKTSPEANETDDLLRRVIAEERPDAFDPDEFNRRHGPLAGSPSLPQRDGPTP